VADSIDPFARKKAPVAKPGNPEQQKDLLARATGAAPKRVTLPTPAAAKQIPGITGNMPLPAGKVVGQIAPSSLTAIERKTLEASGWTPDIALPTSQEGLKQLQAEVASMNEVEVPLPVDPRTPTFVPPDAVPMGSLPAAKQQQLRATMASIAEGEKQRQAAAKREMELGEKEAQIKGMGAAGSAADQAVRAFDQKVAAKAPPPAPEPDGFEIEVEQAPPPRPAPTAPQPQPEPIYQPQATSPTHSDTGIGGAMLSYCPHCSWDLSIPDIDEPPAADKQAFLHCLLGETPFVKSYMLFGDNVEVTFRTLTTRELDVIYVQAYADRQTGKLPNELDYWERINRYRLMLQLQSFKTFGAKGFVKDLPDGYSKAANPGCTGTWVNEEREAALLPNETGIPVIEQYLVEEVLKTEAVFRVVNNTCNQFNRLAAKMEAMCDNSDFWNPTGGQS